MHVLSSLQIGGAERFVLDLSQVQQRLGHEITVFSCGDENDPLLAEADKLNIPAWVSANNRWQEYRRVMRFFSRDGGVFQIHSPAALRYFLPVLPLLRLKNVRIVYTRHGLNPLVDPAWVRIHRVARPFVHCVTFVSAAGLEVFHERFGWPRKMLTTISNGIYVPDAAPPHVKDVLRIGSVGRMVELKGQSHLIDVLHRLEEKGFDQIEVHFFGDGPEREALHSAASGLKRITCTFHGMELDREKVYGSFDLLVVCSEQEGLSLAIMEAMARGRPAVATSVGDSPRLVIDGVTGYLYDYGDRDALEGHLLSLKQDGDLLERLGQQARTHIDENFSLESTDAAYQQVYGA